MAVTRRDFVKGLLATVLGVAGLPALLKAPGLSLKRVWAGPRAEPMPTEQGPGAQHRWSFVVDVTKCIGCGLCVQACKDENYVVRDPEFNRTWVERYVYTPGGEVFVDSPEAGINGFQHEPENVKYANLEISKAYFVPKLCNQCDSPPCVQVCPVGATYITEDRVVLVDQDHCIGCGYCIQACPYGARYLDPRVHVADKCTWCYHRIHRGLKPACVEVCPVGARVFGDLLDPESEVGDILKQYATSVLKPALGTEPKVRYLGIDSEVR